jgi:hypothetical protein
MTAKIPTRCLAMAAIVLSLSIGPANAAGETTGAGSTSAAAEKAQTPRPRPDRVYVRDVEGLWISQAYLDALRAVRHPHAAARKARPIAIKIQRDGPSYPIMRTDFDKAVLQRVIDVEPDGKPNAFRLVVADDDRGPVSAADATYIKFRGSKGVDGRLSSLEIAEPTFAKGRFLTYIRSDEGMGPLVNGIVIAGRYTDDEGREYQFDEAGEARLPEGAFAYEISLAAAGARCEYFELVPQANPDATKRRMGFLWKSGKLQLFAVSGNAPAKLRCDKKPFAVLTPVAQ